MSTNFSAGPQTLGYLHQVRYSLYSLLADQRGDTYLYVEELDDVVRKSSGITTLEQLKHHTTIGATVNEYSTELWRTLRVWFTKFDEGELKPEEAMLCLITTASAQENTPLAWLRRDNLRDVAQARARLSEVANTSGNQSLKKAFDIFNKFSEVNQERLLSAVYVIDNAPTIDEVVPKIKHIITGIHACNKDAAYERLEGWWFNLVVEHLLNESKVGISQYFVKEKIADIAQHFQPNSLPIDYEDYEPDSLQIMEGKNRQFAHQIGVLKIGGRRLHNAVLDYYRAFSQRSRWLRESLHIDDELVRYEKRLIREWDRQLGILESMEAQGTEEEQIAFGIKLLDWMEQRADFPIRTNMPAGHEYVMRGSFHWLADASTPTVFWHPKFLEQLEAILATPTKP